MGDAERLYNAWVTAMPAPDVEGQWVAHCLDFDVVSQGTSLQHAIDMISEATGMVLFEDLQNGRDPHARRAPVEDFELLWNLLRNGDRVPEEVAFSDTTGKYVYAFPIIVEVQRVASPTSTAKPGIASAKAPAHVAFAHRRTG